VRYFATMTDDVQQVAITFKALRWPAFNG
jgi:hypothetical protein